MFKTNLFLPHIAHWAQFFKKNDLVGNDQPEYIFDWVQVKDVHKSFLDSIVVELSLPASPWKRQILLHLLREAIEENPRDAKRFPQALWDAMGDFSVCKTYSRTLKHY